jgi:hypothetical protein
VVLWRKPPDNLQDENNDANDERRPLEEKANVSPSLPTGAVHRKAEWADRLDCERSATAKLPPKQKDGPNGQSEKRFPGVDESRHIV